MMSPQERMELANRILEAPEKEARKLAKKAPQEFVEWAWAEYFDRAPGSTDYKFFDRLTDVLASIERYWLHWDSQ